MQPPPAVFQMGPGSGPLAGPGPGSGPYPPPPPQQQLQGPPQHPAQPPSVPPHTAPSGQPPAVHPQQHLQQPPPLQQGVAPQVGPMGPMRSNQQPPLYGTARLHQQQQQGSGPPPYIQPQAQLPQHQPQQRPPFGQGQFGGVQPLASTQASVERLPLGQMLAASGPTPLPPELAASSAPLGQLLSSVRPHAGPGQAHLSTFGGVSNYASTVPQLGQGQQQQHQHQQQQQLSHGTGQPMPLMQQQHPPRPPPPQQRRPGMGAAVLQQLHGAVRPPPASLSQGPVSAPGPQPPGIGDDTPSAAVLAQSRAGPASRFGPAASFTGGFIPGLDSEQLPGLGDDEAPQAQSQPAPQPQQQRPVRKPELPSNAVAGLQQQEQVRSVCALFTCCACGPARVALSIDAVGAPAVLHWLCLKGIAGSRWVFFARVT